MSGPHKLRVALPTDDAMAAGQISASACCHSAGKAGG